MQIRYNKKTGNHATWNTKYLAHIFKDMADTHHPVHGAIRWSHAFLSFFGNLGLARLLSLSTGPNKLFHPSLKVLFSMLLNSTAQVLQAPVLSALLCGFTPQAPPQIPLMPAIHSRSISTLPRKSALSNPLTKLRSSDPFLLFLLFPMESSIN